MDQLIKLEIMNIEENNKMIAEFMGYEEQTDPSKRWLNQFFNPKTGERHVYLFFNSSWDWLMPVIKKIDSIANEGMSIEEFDNYRTQWAMIDKPSKYFIENVFNQVAEFIEWHNKNKD